MEELMIWGSTNVDPMETGGFLLEASLWLATGSGSHMAILAVGQTASEDWAVCR